MHRNALVAEATKDETLKVRMLSEIQAQAYTGLGRCSIRKLGAEIGAIKHFGRRVLYDRVIIDKYFDAQ